MTPLKCAASEELVNVREAKKVNIAQFDQEEELHPELDALTTKQIEADSNKKKVDHDQVIKETSVTQITKTLVVEGAGASTTVNVKTTTTEDVSVSTIDDKEASTVRNVAEGREESKQ